MIIAEICSISNYSKKYSMRKDLYDSLAEKYKKFYFINCHHLVDKEKINVNLNIFKNKKIFFFHPKSYQELNNFLKKNNIFLINNLSPKFYHLKIHLLINRKNIYQVAIDNLGEMSSYRLENWDTVNFDKKIYFLYLKKLSFVLYRLLVAFRIIKSVDKLFIARKDVKKKYASKSNIFRNFFGKRYLKIQPIKPKFPFYDKLKLKEEKYIVFLDQNVNHQDNISRGHGLSKLEQIDYLKKIKNYLNKLSKISKKKAVICLHPSSNSNLYKKYIKKIKIVKFQTEYYILKAFLIIFHDSSSVTSAFFLNKKVINLKSDILGPYINRRSELYHNKVKLISHDLNNYKQNLNKNIFNVLEKNIKNHKKFMKKIFFIEKKYRNLNETLYQEIEIVKKNEFFKKNKKN